MRNLPTRKTENWKYSVPPVSVAALVQQTAVASQTLPAEAEAILSAVQNPLAYSTKESHSFFEYALEQNQGEYVALKQNNSFHELRLPQTQGEWGSYVFVIDVAANVHAECELKLDHVWKLANVVLVVNLAKGAELTVYSSLSEHVADQAANLVHMVIEQAEHSRFNVWQYEKNTFEQALFLRTDIRVRLRGEQAACTMRGLIDLNKRTHSDHHLRVDHLAPLTRSEQLYKCVLDGQAHGVFNGKAVIHPNCPGSVAMQHNHNLMLSAGAAIDTKPELEIYTDDVECAHGATVGQLDADALFYCHSRGIPQAQAQALLLDGFKQDVFAGLKNEAIKTRWGM